MSVRGTVLLVEDEADIRDAMADVLRDEGYVVIGAADGREALTWLAANPRPCVILLDLFMPVMGGIEFRERQLEDPKLAAIPVVIVSAVDRERAAALHITQYVAKPIDLDELLAHVRKHCR